MSSDKCIICGEPVGAGSLRCIRCRGEETRRRALVETADRDRDLLSMVDDQHMTHLAIAAVLGISRTQAGQKVKLARSRQAMREEMALV